MPVEEEEKEQKSNTSLRELLRKLNINKRGSYSDEHTYVIDLKDSDEYGSYNSLLERNGRLKEIDESSFVTADNAALDYRYKDEYLISLVADFNEDTYKIVIIEM